MSNRLDDSIFGSASAGPARPGGSGDGGATGTPAQPLTRAQRHAAPSGKRPPRSGRRLLLMTLVTLLVLGGGGYFALHQLKPLAESVFGAFGVKDYEGDGTGQVTFVVDPGDTGRQIGEKLVSSGVVMTVEAFEGALTDIPGKAIQPGTYSVRTEMSAAAALAMLRDDANRNAGKVTVREGMRADEIVALLAKTTGRPVAQYASARRNPSAIGLPAEAKGNVEGFLFPATYTFNPDDDATDQLTAMVAKMTQELNLLKVPAAQRRRLVIMASLIEGEAGSATDRPNVARVMENRLAKGMRLQLDSTVSYGVGRRGSITTTDAERADRNPYNTYMIPGLPAGPISNPGVASLKAALNPAPGSWLFFVTVNPETGLTRFATTPEEHAANVREFQGWCRANRGKC